MQVLDANDYKIFTTLVKLSPQGVLRTLQNYLNKKYSHVISNEKYLIAEGSIPIALVAHVDTVFTESPKNVYYDKEKGVIWSPEGLGADDRAGVFAILKILQSNLRPAIILTTDEEMGGLGADALIKDFPFCPIQNLRYIIELDRCGTNDCVFYECDNKDFIRYVESFGFIQNFGTFSDISIICPQWKIAGVNLSIGYEDEHSFQETLHLNSWGATINKVKVMLREVEIPFFEYIEDLSYYSKWFKKWHQEDMNNYIACDNCGKAYEEFELFPTLTKHKKIRYYCPDCCVEQVEWCNVCGTAYQKHLSICPKCHTRKDV